MAVQTTTTTANRSHIVEGLNGFVSMRTSIALGRGGWSCRIGANLVVGLFHGRGVWLFWKWGDVVDQLRALLFTVQTYPHWEQRYTRWTVRDRGHGWGTTQHPSKMTVALSGNPLVKYGVRAMGRLTKRGTALILFSTGLEILGEGSG